MVKHKYTCVICHKEFTGYGNNPYPVATQGECCNECNRKVVFQRLRAVMMGRKVEHNGKVYEVK